jgi:hypothetical protein
VIGRSIALFVALSIVAIGYARPASARPLTVTNCSRVTTTRPGVGNVFRGVVANDDYGFVARIPRGLKGWGGVAQDAPFHGFTIFLNPQMSACILFEVHVRVDEEDAPRHPHSASPMWFGKARAWQSIHDGEVESERLTNISTSFSFKRPAQIDDGEVLLIAPTSMLPEVKRRYDAFVRSLKFRR